MECRLDISPFLPEILTDEDQLLERKSFQVIACISKVLKLDERGADVFFNKVRNMVSYEMEARFLNKDLGDGVVDLINSTKDDLVDTILNSYSSPDSSMSVGQVKGSLEDSQNTSQETLDQFFNFFRNDLLKALKDPSLTGFSKNDLCFRVLPYLNEDKISTIKEIYNSCHEAVMQEYKNGPVIRFSDYVQKIPAHGLHLEKFALVNPEKIADRYCMYRKYNNANQLVELQKDQAKRNFNLK